jgi:hypothetical protein
MGLCRSRCCCDDDDDADERYRFAEDGGARQTPNRQAPGQGNSSARGAPAAAPVATDQRRNGNGDAATRCRYCSKTIHTALLDGHEETCRAQIKRGMRRTDQPAGPTSTGFPATPTPAASATTGAAAAGNTVVAAEESVEDPCVVCFDGRKTHAMIPCGHLALCGKCAAALKECPICRGPKESLLQVAGGTSAVSKCRRCKHIIHPTVFDSHQEVCALRMRQRAAAQAAEVEKDIAGRQSSCHLSEEQCVECHSTQSAMVTFVPCGHALMCATCALRVSHCPACLQRVTTTLTTFSA